MAIMGNTLALSTLQGQSAWLSYPAGPEARADGGLEKSMGGGCGGVARQKKREYLKIQKIYKIFKKYNHKPWA
jgi:hypothetical protein